VLSPYGDVKAVSPDEDGRPRERDRPHDGVDFGPASKGDPVIASADGIVIRVSSDRELGTEVRVVHDGIALDRESGGAKYVTGYLHLERATVRNGQRVARGEQIGTVGLFWASGGVVHVHWRLCRGHDCRVTLDPTQKAAGCYARDVTYPVDKLVLTYPLRC
jgi:murein DD-endopeptidase MepM/ murein hydrolase activator NlpD